MAEESLDYTINIKTQATLKNLDDLRKAAERVKAEMVDVAKTSDEAFSTIAKKVGDTAEDFRKQGIGKGKEETLAYALAVKELNVEAKQTATTMRNFFAIISAGSKFEEQATVSFMNTMKGINTTAAQAQQQVGGLGSIFDSVKEKLGGLGQVGQFVFGTVLGPVSYTHLTLPTTPYV